MADRAMSTSVAIEACYFLAGGIANHYTARLCFCKNFCPIGLISCCCKCRPCWVRRTRKRINHCICRITDDRQLNQDGYGHTWPIRMCLCVCVCACACCSVKQLCARRRVLARVTQAYVCTTTGTMPAQQNDAACNPAHVCLFISDRCDSS